RKPETPRPRRETRRNEGGLCRGATRRGIAGSTVRRWLHQAPTTSVVGAAFFSRRRAHRTPEPCLENLGVRGRAPANPIGFRDHGTIGLRAHSHCCPAFATRRANSVAAAVDRARVDSGV